MIYTISKNRETYLFAITFVFNNDLSSFVAHFSFQSIVATTCLGVAGSAVFSKRTFDVCIIDEASQVQQLTTLAPLFVSKRFVLVGDNKQLPPIVKSVQAR